MLLEEKHERTTQKGWPTLVLYLVAFFMAVLSFIPILALSGSENLFSVYNDAQGMARGERARMHDAIRLATSCNSKLHELQRKFTDDMRSSKDLELLNERSLLLVEQLLSSESKFEILSNRGMEDHVKLTTMKETMHMRIAALNATYVKAFREAKKKLNRIQEDYQSQVILNEKLEADLHNSRKQASQAQETIEELKQSIAKAKEKVVELEHRHVTNQIEATNPTTMLPTSIKSQVVDDQEDNYLQENQEIIEVQQPTSSSSSGIPNSMETTVANSITRRECDQKVAIAQSEMQDDIDTLTQKLASLQQQLLQVRSTPSTPPPTPCSGKLFEYNSDRGGVPIDSQVLNSARKCKDWCMAQINCKAWTYHKVEGRCDIKAVMVSPTVSSCCVSGVKCA